MSFGGSIQGMLTTLKNNRELLKSRLSKNKGTRFEENDYSFEFKKLSEEEMLQFKIALRKKRKKENALRKMILASLAVLFLTFMALLLFYPL